MGYRVLDPVTYKFSTEIELIFDEHSARKRINSYYEYDARCDLQKKGKLSTLPLLADDFASRDTTQEAVRNVFSSPSRSSIDISESGGACDEVVSKEGAASDGSLLKFIASES